jgi:hypothetical protein
VQVIEQRIAAVLGGLDHARVLAGSSTHDMHVKLRGVGVAVSICLLGNVHRRVVVDDHVTAALPVDPWRAGPDKPPDEADERAR